MLLNWDDPPTLSSPKREAQDPRDRERLARVKDRRRKHKPSKAHATGKRNARIRASKKATHKRAIAERESAVRAYREAVRAFWRGMADQHPSAPC
jgi:hypothetical protein